MILVDFSKIAHLESAGGKVNFQVIAILNLRAVSNNRACLVIPEFDPSAAMIMGYSR